ncbi:Ca-activated chloride channel homolog [Mytilus galloprovincialis]|uniref:Ca-activated chloride channel homolog n=2 Tax=Mytilus galloprovincialis TaxID=29158 RepID=A0A8B6HRH2_MYTGA|nr:Ca-activated chloride channel homolog [Mytilus galloprovincialis]
MFTVCEIQILQGAWDYVLKQISFSNPESVAVKVVKEDCKMVIVGHKVPVDEVAELIGIIMKDVATEHDRKKLQVTEEVSLKHFQLLVLLHLYFLNNMEKEFEGLHIQVDRKKHIVIFTGRSSHVHAAKVKMFEQIQELTGLIVGKFSVGYIEFLKIPEVKTYISQQIQQKGVLGVWNVEEGNIITMYSLSDEGAVTACDVLKKSIIETPIPLDDKQISALLETDIWNKEIKAVEIEYQKALVKIVLADSKTFVIYQTSAEDKEILKEKVTDILYCHATSKKKIQLSSSEIRLLKEQYQIELNTLKEQSAKDHVTLILDNISVYIQGNSKRVKDTKQKIDDILRSIYRKKYTIKKAGIVKHMRSEQGQAKISQVEKKNNVIIHLQTGNDNDDEEQDNRSKSEPISPKKTYKETAMCTIPSGQTIITVVGDITELDVDVIVNSANKELQHVGGLAKVIVDKGGKSIQKECDNYVGSKNRARKMYEGEIFCSSPGQLNCKMIVHAVGPVWQNGCKQEDEYLSECIQTSLEKTEDEKYKSIAIPALCTGILGYPPNKATKVIVEAIRDYVRENGASSPIRQIYLCDVKEDIVDHFVSALERYFDKSNIKKQRGKSDHVSSSPVRSRHVSDYYGSCLSPKRPSCLDSHITVTLVKGQIASQKVDVIVNTTSTSLQLNQGAMSQSLLKMGGQGIQGECSQKYPNGIQPGEMAETTGGKLECKMIYHGALPGYNGSTAMKIMETFIKNCLEIANDNGFVSVAFPALGTGNLGYPKNQVAKNMFSCVDRFSSSHPTSSVCDVRFVVYDKDYPTIKAFEEEQRKRQRLSAEYVSTQTKSLGLDDTTYQEEKKAVSTKQWTVSKMPSSVLNLVVYAKKENDADSALRSLEESLINDYKEKNIDDALIKELSEEQETAILKLEETCEVEIEFNKKIGCINVRGLIENLSNAIDEVHKIIRDLDRQKQKQQQHAKIVPDMVQWYFFSIEDTGQKLEEYPQEVNLILEQAFKKHEPQAFFLNNSGNKYVVDFNTYEEFPEDDPSDTVVVLRKSKLTGSGFDMPSNWASMDQYENIKIVTLQPADKEYQDIVHNFQTNMAGNYNSIVKVLQLGFYVFLAIP